jgi:hypothetical protein
MLSMWHAGLRLVDVRDPENPTEVAYFNPGDATPGDDVRLDRAWGHVRYVPETGHIWFATASGGFWVVEIEPQVREHLALDAEPGVPPPVIRFPAGRPARAGLATTSGGLVDVAPLYCTLA